MGGPLVALSLAYKSDIRSDGILETIEEIISEYRKSAYYVNDIIYWPGRVTLEQYIGQSEIEHIPNRMSWCYGSIGILRAMYIASVSISDKENEQFILNEFIKIAKMNLSDYLISSPIVCHGYVGAAAVMKEMFNDINKPEFLERAIELSYLAIGYYMQGY